MRDRIEELESNTGLPAAEMNNDAGSKPEQVKQLEKAERRLKSKQVELKKLNGDLVDQKNELAKGIPAACFTFYLGNLIQPSF